MKPLFAQEPTAQIFNGEPAHSAPAPQPLVVVEPKSMVAAPPLITESDIAKLGEQAAAGLAMLPNKLISDMRSADAEEFGVGLNQLVVVAKGLDPRSMEGKGIVSRIKGLFHSGKERLLAQYNTVEKQMDALVAELDKKAALHQSRIADFDQLYQSNMAYHEQLSQALEKGLKLAEQLKPQVTNASASDAFDAQRISDIQRLIDRLEKRVDDLRRAMLLSKQTAPQIRLMQDNAQALVQKFADVKTVTLPAWKNAFSLYLLHLEQKQAVSVLTAVDDATDAALRQGADILRQNTEDITRARQRSLVSVETLEHVQSQLLGAFTDMQRINDEGKATRKASEAKLLSLEQELITKFVPGQR